MTSHTSKHADHMKIVSSPGQSGEALAKVWTVRKQNFSRKGIKARGVQSAIDHLRLCGQDKVNFDLINRGQYRHVVFYRNGQECARLGFIAPPDRSQELLDYANGAADFKA